MATPINDIIYDGFSFATAGIVFSNVNHMELPSRNNQIETRANRSGGVLVQSFLGTKSVYLEGYYDGSSQADAQTMYDVLAQVLNRQERQLKIPHLGDYRIYTATPANVIMSQPNGLNRLTFSFEFIVPDGYAKEQATSSLFNTTITTAQTTIDFTVGGSVLARPMLVFTFDTVTGGTGKTVSIRNSRDLIGLTITRDFASSDTISIDSENFQIYINGVLTEPEGRLPTWSPGTGALYYSDTFTTRSVSASGTYVKKNI